MTKKTHKAIILAAGKGLRLRKILKGKPKPLLKIGNKTLIENLIEKLKDLNVKKIILVTGYKSNEIKKIVKNKVKCIYYPNYNRTNNLHTLLHIKNELKGPLLCLFSDVIFDKKILKLLLKTKNNICLAVDKKTKLSGTMRIKTRGALINQIGNHIKVKNSNGNFIGFAKFSKLGCKLLKKTLEKYKNSNFNDYYTQSLNELIKKRVKVHFKNMDKYNWKEIDTVQDYHQAKKISKIILKNEKK